MGFTRWTSLALFGSLCMTTTLFAADAVEPQMSELRNGRWQVVNTPSTQPTAILTDPRLDRIEDVISQGRYGDARKSLIVWLKANPASPVRDRALFLMADDLYRADDWIKSFYYCDELLDKYPASPLFESALNLQYQIADGFLNGHRRKLLGLHILGAQEEAIEMLFRIQQRSPGSELAEKCLLRTADYYYATSQFDLAVDAYQQYINSYPRSPLIARVKLRQAFSNLAQFRGLRFDPTPVIDARTQLINLAADYPDLADKENIPALLTRIDATFAKKLYVTADFYKRTHEPKAAAYVYEYLVLNYPNSPEAAKAKVQLKGLPQPEVPPATPSTNPVASAE